MFSKKRQKIKILSVQFHKSVYVCVYAWASAENQNFTHGRNAPN